MTGHGQAAGKHGDVSIDVEIRTVNNRFLKVATKVSEIATAIEPHVENILREHVKRGTVNVSIRVSQAGKNNAATINQATLESYLSQAKAVSSGIGLAATFEIGQFLLLPGVLESSRPTDDEVLIEAVRNTLVAAVLDLQAMRSKEGNAMESQFGLMLDQIEGLKQSIAERAPDVVAEYRRRLDQKVRTALSSLGQESQEIDILREVLLFADRCDISEEITRLTSHLAQFREAIASPESQGRRLDFLIQELFRETNTMGSKSNDSRTSQLVVSIKTIIEQMRELVQNVE
ncbi:MAG: YicC/YloC family endoribonuclease [Pirellula sp.]